jgi:3',5'-cyclic AMP phosphodiesterase CpdA
MTLKRYLFLIILALCLYPALVRAQGERFAVISDTHVGASNSACSSVMKTMEDAHISLIVHCGDAIHRPGDPELWTMFLGMTAPGTVLHLAPGNHDIRGKESVEVYNRFFPSLYHDFSMGDTLLVLLNTEIPGEESLVTGEQLEWLTSELKRPFRYKFVFLHEPLYPVVPFHGLDRHKKARDRLHRIFVENGVSLVVAGHDHIYRRSMRKGITYIVAGSTGGKPPPWTRNGSAFRYMVATRVDDEYVFDVRDMGGGLRDAFVLGPEKAGSDTDQNEEEDLDGSMKQGDSATWTGEK